MARLAAARIGCQRSHAPSTVGAEERVVKTISSLPSGRGRARVGRPVREGATGGFWGAGRPFLRCGGGARPRERERVHGREAFGEVVGKGVPIERQGVDIVFVLDTSLSMATRDVSPNRLWVAQTLIRQLAQQLPGHRVALVQAEGDGVVRASSSIRSECATRLVQIF